MRVFTALFLLNCLFGANFAQANSKSTYYSFLNDHRDHSSPYGPQTQYQINLNKAFSKFIYSLLKKEVETEKIQFDSETQQYISKEIKIKSHIKVKLSDIISGHSDKTSQKNGLWVKPYVRDIYFQTRTMVCKYSYRSKYKKPRKSLSGHFVHENHGSLDCKDIENGTGVKPYVFGKKNLVFIAEITSEIEDYSNSENVICFRVNDSKRNKTYY